MKKALVALVVVGLMTVTASAVVLFTGAPYTQNFNTLGSVQGPTYTWTDDVTLNGWYATHGGGASYTPFTTYKASFGNDVTHTIHSFGVDGNTDRAFGCLSYNDNTLWGVRLTNNAGAAATEFTLTYTGEQWRNQSTTNVDFAYSTTAASLDGAGFINADSLDFIPPQKGVPPPYELDGNAAANRVTYSQTIVLGGGGWAPGTDLWLRWSTGPGQGGAVGIDDLTFTAVIPEPAGLLMLALGGALLGWRRSR